MPRNYSRKSNRQSWNADSMLKLIEAVKNGEMWWLRASKSYKIPQATLRRHALEKNKVLKIGEKSLVRFKPTFSIEVERQLVEHLKLLESRFFGLTRRDVLELAYKLAVQNGFDHHFNDQKKAAGKDWLRGFRKRNPDITLRKPEATSAARAQAFNKPQVAQFFKVLEKNILKERIDPMKIYNADESALSTVQRPQKVFATAGRKQVGAITSAERGSHVTVVCCMCTNGNFVPPALIFPRKNMKIELTDHTPVGTLCIAQESGWMTGPVFLQWLQHFQKYVKASPTEKVLLIVDGHSSHKYLDALVYAKENGIVLLCLPPHCTHRMQPLDVAFFGPLKTYYDQEITKWLKAHPGKVVTQFQIGGLLNEAYGKAASVQNAIHGFAKTGIYPMNPDVFPDYMFQASETTNILLDDSVEQASNVPTDNSAQSEASTSAIEPPLGISTAPLKNLHDSTTSGISILITPADLSPVPVGPFVSGQGKRKPRKRQTTSVLNSTPNLEEAKEKSKPKIKIPEKRKRAVSRKVLAESDSETEKEPYYAEEEECACIYCTELFKWSKKGDLWLCCCSCKKWAHADCAGVDKKVKIFVCELCTN